MGYNTGMVHRHLYQIQPISPTEVASLCIEPGCTASKGSSPRCQAIAHPPHAEPRQCKMKALKFLDECYYHFRARRIKEIAAGKK